MDSVFMRCGYFAAFQLLRYVSALQFLQVRDLMYIHIYMYASTHTHNYMHTHATHITTLAFPLLSFPT